jgi:uroporphyrin-III C-methyltransferase/precorrin-2 dehydrogenase/sirohydrochlorin ferrochelatase
LLAKALEAARPVLRGRLPDGAERRRTVDAALREGGALDPFNPQAHERVPDWAAGATMPRAGEVIEITLNSPDPEDLTLGQARLLGEADTLLLDRDVPPAILARARADAARLPWDGAAPPVATDARGLTLLLRYRPRGIRRPVS